MSQISYKQQAHLEEQLTCRNLALSCALLSQFIKPNIYSEQVDVIIAAFFSIHLYIALYIAHSTTMMRLWDRSAFLNGWISASQKVRVDSSWSSSQSKQLSIFLMVQNRLQSEHSAYSFVEFILKCISNRFDNPETFILCQYPRADCVTFYILYWHVLQFVLPRFVPTRFLEMHVIEWSGFLRWCQYNFADVTTADASLFGSLLFLHLWLNFPSMNRCGHLQRSASTFTSLFHLLV